jgi:hypothetical protein
MSESLEGKHIQVKPRDIDAATDDRTWPTRPLLQRAASESYRATTEGLFALVDDQFSGLTLLDLFVVLESRIDLLQRRIKVASREFRETLNATRSKAHESYQGLRTKADEVLAGRSLSFTNLSKDPSMGEGRRKPTSERVEREVAKFKGRVSRRLERFQERWNDASSVSLREKISFQFGVMNSGCFCSVREMLIASYSRHCLPDARLPTDMDVRMFAAIRQTADSLQTLLLHHPYLCAYAHSRLHVQATQLPLFPSRVSLRTSIEETAQPLQQLLLR